MGCSYSLKTFILPTLHDFATTPNLRHQGNYDNSTQPPGDSSRRYLQGKLSYHINRHIHLPTSTIHHDFDMRALELDFSVRKTASRSLEEGGDHKKPRGLSRCSEMSLKDTGCQSAREQCDSICS
jgi:hypothetical protein